MNEQQPRITARPALYINVEINGQLIAYDLPTAQALQQELTMALTQLQKQQEAARQGGSETASDSSPPQPDGADPKSVGAKRSVAA